MRSGGGHNGFNGSRNLGGRGGAGSHNLGGSHSFEHAGAHGTISHTGNLTNHTHSGTTTISTQKATATYTGSMFVNARDSYQHQNTSTITTKEGNQAYSGKTTFTEATDLRVFTHSGSLNMTKKGIAHDGAVAIKATRTERTVNHKGTVTSSHLVHDGATSIDRYTRRRWKKSLSYER